MSILNNEDALMYIEDNLTELHDALFDFTVGDIGGKEAMVELLATVDRVEDDKYERKVCMLIDKYRQVVRARELLKDALEDALETFEIEL